MGRPSRCLAWACRLALLAPAAAGFSARLEGDELVVTDGWREHTRVHLSGHQSLYDPPREDETVWRRVGSSGRTHAAALVRQTVFGERPELSHVFVMWPDGHVELKKMTKDAWDFRAEQSNLTVSFRRRLAEFSWGGDQFTDCWPGQANGMRAFKLGIGFDDAFLAKFGDVEQAQRFTEEMVSTANIIYENQFSIHISIGKMLTKQDWDNEKGIGGSCDNIGRIQDRLPAWNNVGVEKLRFYNLGAWMLLTNCHPPPGVVGLAYVNVQCSLTQGYGVSNYMPNGLSWHTFTHELGHILGAHHSFENGQGSTGGIMDYGDGKYQGAYQFHPYRKKEMCAAFQRTMVTPASTDAKNCWTSWDPMTDVDFHGSWFEAWGACDIDCRPNEDVMGKQTLEITCRRIQDGPVLDPSNCDPETMPKAETKACDIRPPMCSGASRWVYSGWSNCTSVYGLTCGSGQQEREARCVKGDNEPADDCSKRTPEKKDCRIKDCVNKFTWVQDLTEWVDPPSCSFSEGYRLRKIVCLDTQFMTLTKDDNCMGLKPQADFEKVDVDKCPKVENACCLDEACLTHSAEGDCEFTSTFVDVAVCVPHLAGRGFLYEFFGKQVRVMPGCDRKNREKRLGYITTYFSGIPETWDRVDAAIAGPSDYAPELLLFRGEEVVRWNLIAGTPNAGYPKPIEEEFPSLVKSCPICKTKVVTGLFDEVSRTFRVWCGDASTYCLGNRQWNHVENIEWVARPTQDFGLTQIRSITRLVNGMVTMLSPTADSYAIAKGSSLPAVGTKSEWWTGAPFSKKDEKRSECSRLSFCVECDVEQTKCSACEAGFSSMEGRCVPYQARIWLDGRAAIIAASSDPDADASDKFPQVEGPFLESVALAPQQQLPMKPIVKEKDGSLVTFRKWSMSLWVKGHGSDVETIIHAPQAATDDTLKITWSECGPGIQSKNFRFNCDVLGKVAQNEWVFVGIHFRDSLTIDLNGKKVRMEADIPPLQFQDWSIGSNDGEHRTELALLAIEDYEVWPKVELSTLTTGSKALIVVAIVVGIACLVAMFFVFRVAEKLPSQVWWHLIVEGYIIAMNFLFCLFGMTMMCGNLALLATQEIGIMDLFSSGLIAGDLRFLLWPFWIGMVAFGAGLVGIRTARTRKGSLLFFYIIMLAMAIGLSSVMWLRISDTELGLEQHGGIVSDLSNGGDQLYYKARAPFYRTVLNTYRSLVKADQYDCDITEGQTGDCAAHLGGAPIMQCMRPHPAARAFQNLVNHYCVEKVDVSSCGRCLENYGQRSELADWDAFDPMNKIFCRCKSAAIDVTVSWVSSSNWVVKCVVLNAVLLLVAELLLICFVPSKRELLQKQADQLFTKSKAKLAELRRRKAAEQERRRTQMMLAGHGGMGGVEMSAWGDEPVMGSTLPGDDWSRRSVAHGQPQRVTFAQAQGQPVQASRMSTAPGGRRSMVPATRAAMAGGRPPPQAVRQSMAGGYGGYH